MHAAVLEAQWDAVALMPRHRAVVAQDQGRRGREVIRLDWTLAHHEWGPEIDGVTKSDDSGERRMARFHTGVTAVSATRTLVDGLAVRGQEPSVREAKEASGQATAREGDEQMAHVRRRLLE
jgi:hypothetical protein